MSTHDKCILYKFIYCVSVKLASLAIFFENCIISFFGIGVFSKVIFFLFKNQLVQVCGSFRCIRTSSASKYLFIVKSAYGTTNFLNFVQHAFFHLKIQN